MSVASRDRGQRGLLNMRIGMRDGFLLVHVGERADSSLYGVPALSICYAVTFSVRAPFYPFTGCAQYALG
jgi:hypothetical protein